MKRKIFWLLVVMVVGLISSNLLMGVPQDEEDKSTFGKVIGQIIDPETGKPVNVSFEVCLFDWNYRGVGCLDRKDCDFETDENGYIVMDLPPGQYGLLFSSGGDKYAPTYNPLYEEMPEEYKKRFSCPITVETGKRRFPACPLFLCMVKKK